MRLPHIVEAAKNDSYTKTTCPELFTKPTDLYSRPSDPYARACDSYQRSTKESLQSSDDVLQMITFMEEEVRLT